MKKGSPISIKASLKNVADSLNIPYQNIITRYFQERLLHRLTNSNYSANFFLKGGALLYVFEGISCRPTVDIDMLAKQISNDKLKIKQIFQEICNVKYNDDCVIFDTATIQTSDIAEDAKYTGIRVLVDVRLDTIKQRLQIDIGFGDVITPAPVKLEYPVLLNDLEKPKINAYSIETVIAEKFQAMIRLGVFNSRMKDFYDVYILLNNNQINDEKLKDAIFQTFKNRKTDFTKDHELFTENFYQNQNRQLLWNSFLRKMKISDDLNFPFVIETINNRLQPIYLFYPGFRTREK